MALAERGEPEEARNAKNTLDRLLKEHGLTLDDLSESAISAVPFKIKEGTLSLFCMCILFLIPSERYLRAYRWKGRKNIIYVEVTKLEQIELIQMYEFHARQFLKEKKQMMIDFERAYQHKHQLYAPSDGTEPESSVLSREEVKRILLIVDGLEDITYRKQLK